MLLHLAQRARAPRVRLLCATLALALGLSGASLSAALEAGVGPSYHVQSGDTLGKIAAAAGVSVQRLAQLNGIANPDFIRVGQVLRLDPAAPGLGDQAEQVAATAATYTVRAGDTLGQIAAREGVSARALAELNDLADPHRLRIGQKLRLPARPLEGPSLEQRVLAEIRRVGKGHDRLRVGVAARNLETGQRVLLRADELFASASVMKLPILVELERQVAAGTLAWDARLRAQAGAMMRISDNEAANRLIERLGEANVNATMGRLGLRGTRLLNRFGEGGETTPLRARNQTTPADMLALLELIAGDELVNPQVSASIRAFMEQNADGSKLARPLPKGTLVAHKSGWYEGVANDVGIVRAATGARWAVAVFADGVPDAESGNQVIAAVSKALYDAWGAPR